MDRLLLVDGMNLLFQMFYGMPARIPGRDGRPIHGTLGFVGALLKIIRMTEPSHMAVLFDGEYTSERTALDESYKANRPDLSSLPGDETPFSQLPDIFRSLDFLGIAYQETRTCEADDWLAGYVRRYGQAMDIILASQDSDFFQLISQRVRVLRYRGKQTTLLGETELWEKFGVVPEQYALFKSLTGDTADNIPGVNRVGAKTAAWLIHQFGDMDTLLSQAHQISKPAIQSAILENQERIRRNYAMICLSGDVELPFSLEQLAFQDQGYTTTQVLTAVGVK